MMYEKLLDGSGQSDWTLSELHHLMGIDYKSNSCDKTCCLFVHTADVKFDTDWGDLHAYRTQCLREQLRGQFEYYVIRFPYN